MLPLTVDVCRSRAWPRLSRRRCSANNGQKALAPSGAAVVSQEFSEDPIPLGRIATGLLDVLPVKVHTTPEFAYMRQTTRTNNAAVVAEGQ